MAIPCELPAPNPDGALPHIVITGNPVDGFEFFGPFIGGFTAVEAADEARTSDSGSWHVAPLRPMQGHVSVEHAVKMREVLEWWQAQMADDTCDDMGKLVEAMSAKVNAVIGGG